MHPTITATDTVIYDDMAPTYRDEYQAADRAHRIDNTRKKYDVRYIWMQARYPDEFLNTLEESVRSTYFAMGSFDEIQYLKLRYEKKIFHRIMDGIGSDEELAEAKMFMSESMPFLFQSSDVEPVEKTDQPQNSHLQPVVFSDDVASEFYRACFRNYRNTNGTNSAQEAKPSELLDFWVQTKGKKLSGSSVITGAHRIEQYLRDTFVDSTEFTPTNIKFVKVLEFEKSRFNSAIRLTLVQLGKMSGIACKVEDRWQIYVLREV